jgi:hypothetical protein
MVDDLFLGAAFPAKGFYKTAQEKDFLGLFYYFNTARMRRTPLLELSSFCILNVPSSPVREACGPPQISRL